MRTIETSERLFEKARTLLLGGGQGHKRPGKVNGRYPIYAVRGKGASFWDADGNEYIDYLCAFGPMLVGYGNPDVDAAVKAQVDEGVIFNIHHPKEIELAETLARLIPSCDMLSYFTGGSGATTGAVKIARAVTGRDRVLRCGYHGWHDWADPDGAGVPKAVGALTTAVGYNDLGSLKQALEAHREEYAVFMLEAFQGRGPSDGYLAGVQQLCAEHGTLLCFDEVKTGFRFALGGYQEFTGVTPDLSTFGKALGNGYDVAMVVGKREIMEQAGHVWVAATFHGQLIGVAAAIATIRLMEETDGVAAIWRQGRRLMDGLDRVMSDAGVDARSAGQPPMPRLSFGEGLDELANAFYDEAANRRIYFDPGHNWFISPAHTDEIVDYTIEASADAIRAALERGARA